MNSGGANKNNKGAALRVKFNCLARLSLYISFGSIGIFRGEPFRAIVLKG